MLAFWTPKKSTKNLKKRFGGKRKVATFAARFGEEAAKVAEGPEGERPKD